MSDLDQVIAHLGAALVQSIDSDDQIIMGHVREAHDLAKRARDAANSQTKSPPQTPKHPAECPCADAGFPNSCDNCDEKLLGNLPLQYIDGPDFCTVKDATGGDFALTVQPQLMQMMERALLSYGPYSVPRPKL